MILPPNIDTHHALTSFWQTAILHLTDHSSPRRKTPFDGLLLRQYIKLVVMVVWRQSATEQQNFICSANLKSIMSACQIFLEASRLCDLHPSDIFVTFYESKCNKHEIKSWQYSHAACWWLFKYLSEEKDEAALNCGCVTGLRLRHNVGVIHTGWTAQSAKTSSH